MSGWPVLSSLWSMLVPPRCPVCGRAGAAPCLGCWAQLRAAPWRPPPASIDRCVSVLSYEGAGRELLARLKYRNARDAAAWLIGAMHERCAWLVSGIDAITWAPTTAARRRDRGFDQAELLARGLAQRVAIPARRLLEREPGPAQTGRTRAERAGGPSFRPGAPAPLAVLLVDDVITSGATLTAASMALRAAGAVRVDAVSAARTPLKVRGASADP